MERATFDCSPAPSFRHFWHAMKLRSEFQARLPVPPPPRDLILIVNRNGCDGGPYCKTTRGVKRQAEIEAAAMAHFDGRKLGGVTLQVAQSAFRSAYHAQPTPADYGVALA